MEDALHMDVVWEEGRGFVFLLLGDGTCWLGMGKAKQMCRSAPQERIFIKESALRYMILSSMHGAL